VAKLAAGRYEPAATTWVKIKNRAYSQAEGRPDFFAVTTTARKRYPRRKALWCLHCEESSSSPQPWSSLSSESAESGPRALRIPFEMRGPWI
jgi:hypothetical protein